MLTDSPSLAPDWVFWGLADNYLVRAPYSPLFQHAIQETDTIRPGDSSILKLLVWVPASSPNGSNGIIKIKVFDSLPTQVDTAVFRICKGVGCTYPPIYGPGGGGHTGSHDIATGNISFSLYPNPATDKYTSGYPMSNRSCSSAGNGVWLYRSLIAATKHQERRRPGYCPPGYIPVTVIPGQNTSAVKK